MDELFPLVDDVMGWIVDLESVAHLVESVGKGIRDTADTMYDTVDGMHWSGDGRRGAEYRTDRERRQMRKAADAFDDLATACRNGQTTLGALVSVAKQRVTDLRNDGFGVENDWTVFDKHNYDAAIKAAGDDQQIIDQINTMRSNRWNEAENQDVAMHRLRFALAQADLAVATAIQTALDSLAGLTPATSGMNPTVAQQDADAVRDGKATPDQLERLGLATHLTQNQIDALLRGENVDLPQEQYDYLRGLMQSLNGMSVTDIDHLGDKLPADQQQAVHADVANALQLMSNPQIDTRGKDPDEPNKVVDKGGMSQMPTQIRTLLTEKPTTDPKFERSYTTGTGVEIPRLDDFKALNDLLGKGNSALAQGTDIDRGLLKQGAEIAGTRAGFIPNNSTDTPNSVANMLLARAGTDNVAVNDFLTGGPTQSDGTHRMDVTVTPGGKYDSDSHIADVINHDWKGEDNGVSTVVRTAGEFATDSNASLRELSGGSTRALANYVGAHGDDLLHINTLTGPKELGVANPGMAQALASTLTPYIPEMVGVSPDLLHTTGVGSLSDGALKNIFAVVDSDKTAATHFNTSAYSAVSQLNQQFGTGGGKEYQLASWAGKIDASARDGMQYEFRARGLQAADTLKAETMLFDSVKDGTAFSAKQIPLIGNAVELEVKMTSPEMKAWLLGSVPDLHETVDLSANANPGQRFYNILQGMALTPGSENLRSDPEIGQYFNPTTGQLKTLEEIAGNAPKTTLAEFEAAMRRFQPNLSNYDASWTNAHGKDGLPPK
ncbi:hypothetical protein ACFXHA_24805 [Nocardia sp. NPDC059240]|uniref:TPR repeat region-containing protein n=1 Tax=Nocardia sp. NPDC059240 TaxID=3346786 RepID=UPI0036C314B0